MSDTFTKNYLVEQDMPLEVIGLPAESDNETINISVNKHLDSPARIYASLIPDEFLNFGPSHPITGDGAAKVPPPMDGAIPVFLGAKVGLQSGSVVGSGMVFVNGGAFSLPAAPVGQFVRLACVLRSDGAIDLNFSDPVVDFNDLAAPASLFASLIGLPRGYVDLESVDALGGFKTVGSLTSIIEHVDPNTGEPRIFRFGAGSGSGSGGDDAMKAQSLSSNIITLKRGVKNFPDGSTAILKNSGDLNVELSFNLKTETAEHGVQAPSGGPKTYYLYLDRSALGPKEYFGNADAGAYTAEASSFVVLDSPPDEVLRARYCHITTIRTDASDNFVSYQDRARSPDLGQAAAANPKVWTLNDRLVGDVGEADQIRAGHVLEESSFPSTTGLTVWGMGATSVVTTINPSIGSGDLSEIAGSSDLTAANDILGQSVYNFYATSGGWINSSIAAPVGSFSIGLWAKFSGTHGTERHLCGFTDRWHLSTDGNEVKFYIYDNTQSEIGSIAETVNGEAGWHFIAATIDGSEISLYIDGALVSEGYIASLRDVSDANFFLACDEAGANSFLSPIDEVALHDGTAWTEDDIERLMASKLAHMQGLDPRRQSWNIASFLPNGGMKDYGTELVVDKGDRNNLFLDMMGFEPTDVVDITLYDNGMNNSIGAPVDNKEFYFTFVPDLTQDDYPTYLADDVRCIAVTQKIGTQWIPVVGQGYVGVEDEAPGYLRGDITDLEPSPTTPVRIVVSTSAVGLAVMPARQNKPGIITLPQNGFNKFIGGEYYADFNSANLVEGDSALVVADFSIDTLQDITANNINIEFRPGTTMTTNGDYGLKLSGENISVKRAHVVSGAGTLSEAIAIYGSEGHVSNSKVEANGGNITSAFFVAPGTERAYAEGVVKATSGTIITPFEYTDAIDVGGEVRG